MPRAAAGARGGARGSPDADGVRPARALAARPGVVFTRDQLLAEVWGWRDGSGHRTVDSHVRGLRGNLGAGWVRTVQGVGYALEPAEA